MDINSSFQIGSLTLPHRLIQGPLAGFSCAPFRAMYALFQQPAYAVSEMISARDLITRQPARFVSRASDEHRLCYQISGDDPDILVSAAQYLESIGADMIDLNCGCPKTKIRKKGAGSALLDKPQQLIEIIHAVKSRIQIPLTVKIRLQGQDRDVALAASIANAGADALIVHGRRWQDGYDVACDRHSIARIKQAITIPVIANGDIRDEVSLHQFMQETQCDGYMISRAGTGRPWLYQQLLNTAPLSQASFDFESCIGYFMTHLQGLAQLEHEFQAVLQSKTLVRHYFRPWFQKPQLQTYYSLDSLIEIEQYLRTFINRAGYDS